MWILRKLNCAFSQKFVKCFFTLQFAFSLVAAMESAYMIQYGETGISFSEIDLIDCMVAHNTYTPSRKNSHIDCSNGGPPDKFLDEASTVGLIPSIYGRDHALFYSDTEDYLVKRVFIFTLCAVK